MCLVRLVGWVTCFQRGLLTTQRKHYKTCLSNSVIPYKRSTIQSPLVSLVLILKMDSRIPRSDVLRV